MHAELPAWIKYRWVRADAERYQKPPPFDRAAFLEELREEKRKEADAARLAAQREHEERQELLELLRLKSDIAWLRFQRALVLHLMALQRKANFNPNQPRVPAGNPDGGQWTSEDGGRAVGVGGVPIIDPRVISDATPDDTWTPGAQYAQARRPGIGHNSRQPLNIPPERPPTREERSAVVRELARRAVAVHVLLAAPPWVHEYVSEIQSYGDPPKSLDELHQAVAPKSTPGYQDHHIVGQAARDEPDRPFPGSWVDAPENVVRIPTLKHRDITSWYQSRNDEPPFNGRLPRDYLRGRSWEERYSIGLEVMRKFGVLKP